MSLIFNPLLEQGFENEGGALSTSNFLGTSASNPVTAVQGDYYYNTITNEYVMYNGTKWLSLSSIDYKFYIEGIPPSGNAFMHEGQLCTLSTTPGGVRGMVIPYDATIISFEFHRALAGAANVIVDLYKNNNEAAPIYTHNYTPASPLSYYTSLDIDVNMGDVLGIWNNSAGIGLIQHPYGAIKIKRRY